MTRPLSRSARPSRRSPASSPRRARKSPAPHALTYAPTHPDTIVLDGARYACTALLRCADCGLVVAHYADPDRRRVAPLAAHGSGLADLARGRLPRCPNAPQETAR